MIVGVDENQNQGSDTEEHKVIDTSRPDKELQSSQSIETHGGEDYREVNRAVSDEYHQGDKIARCSVF